MTWFEDRERFVNPYNFVEFEEKCQRSNVSHQPGDLTGYLECSLELLTPVFIPNTSNDKALHRNDDDPEAMSYNFYSYTDLRVNPADGFYLPVIPGSELRGTVRSVFEAAFNGCMSSVEGKRPLSRRTADPKKPGMLEKKDGKWHIIPCDRWMLNTTNHSKGKNVPNEIYNKWKEGQILYVKKSTKNYVTSRGYLTSNPVVEDWSVEERTGTDWREGRLHKGEKFGKRKQHESVFVPNGKNPIPVSEEDVSRLRKVLEQYRDTKINHASDHHGYPDYKVNEEGVTLVYYNEGSPIYMSPACISKEVFSQSVDNLLRVNGGYQPCHDRNDVCPACALFGMVSGGSGKGSRSSRVRFGDACLIEVSENAQVSDHFYQSVTLPELGEPKPGTVEFYTFPPDGKNSSPYGYWTYDYIIKFGNKKPEDKSEELPKTEPKLRGRKFYWHSDKWERHVRDGKTPLDSKMKQRIRPLKHKVGDKPVVFRFRIFFENLTREELKMLNWSLTFGDSDCAHKIGRAKPLGFGSARIRVVEAKLRTIDPRTGEWKLTPLETIEAISETTAPMRQVKLIANWNRKPENVSYPLGEGKKPGLNQKAAHQWFKGNRSREKGFSVNRPSFSKVLPTLEEEATEQDRDRKWLYKLKEG